MTRDADDKVWLGHAQLVQRDVMASNGVVHLIDNVLIPDDGKGLSDDRSLSNLCLVQNTPLYANSNFVRELQLINS